MYISEMKRVQKGFTLIEILIVIGIIAVLAAIVLVAINPARQFAQANNTQRQSNVAAILNAIGQYSIDHKGELPSDVDSGAEEITVDLCNDLVPTYLPALPTDPLSDSEGSSITNCASVGTGKIEYQIETDSDNRVTVSAPNTEDTDPSGTTPDIEVTR